MIEFFKFNVFQFHSKYNDIILFQQLFAEKIQIPDILKNLR